MNKLRRIDSDSVKSCDLVAVYTHGGPAGVKRGNKENAEGSKKGGREGGATASGIAKSSERRPPLARSLPMRPWQI